MKRRTSRAEIRCSFCGKSADQVDKIVTGPSVNICSECIKLCNEVLREDDLKKTRDASQRVAQAARN